MKHITKDGREWDDLQSAENHDTKLFNNWTDKEAQVSDIIAVLTKQTLPNGIQSYKHAFMGCLRKAWEQEKPTEQRFKEVFRDHLIELLQCWGFDANDHINAIIRQLELSINQTHDLLFNKPIHKDFANLRHEISKLADLEGSKYVLRIFDQALAKTLETP